MINWVICSHKVQFWNSRVAVLHFLHSNKKVDSKNKALHNKLDINDCKYKKHLVNVLKAAELESRDKLKLLNWLLMIQTGSNCSASCGKSRTIWSFRSDETNLKKKKKTNYTDGWKRVKCQERENKEKRWCKHRETENSVCIYIYIATRHLLQYSTCTKHLKTFQHIKNHLIWK